MLRILLLRLWVCEHITLDHSISVPESFCRPIDDYPNYCVSNLTGAEGLLEDSAWIGHENLEIVAKIP